MAVTYLPGITAGLENHLAALGGGLFSQLAPGVGEDRRFAELMRSRPELLPVIAQMVRNADPSLSALGDANQDVQPGSGTVADIFNVRNPELLSRIAQAFPASADEQIQTALRNDPTYVPTTVAAAKQAPQVALATGGAQIAEAGAAIPEAQVRRGVAESRIRLGTPELQALAESGQLGLTQQTTSTQLKALQDYDAWLAQQTPDMRSRAAMQLANPALAGSIQRELEFGAEQRLRWAGLSLQEKEMELRAEAARAEANDPVKMFQLFRDLSSDIGEEIILMRKAEEAGDDDQTTVRVARLNELFRMQQTYFPGQVSFVAEEDKRWLIGKGVVFDTVRPMSPEEQRQQRFSTVVDAVTGGRATMQDLTTSQYWGTLSAEDRGYITRAVTDAAHLRTAQQGAQADGTVSPASAAPAAARIPSPGPAEAREAPSAGVAGGIVSGRPNMQYLGQMTTEDWGKATQWMQETGGNIVGWLAEVARTAGEQRAAARTAGNPLGQLSDAQVAALRAEVQGMSPERARAILQEENVPTSIINQILAPR